MLLHPTVMRHLSTYKNYTSRELGLGTEQDEPSKKDATGHSFCQSLRSFHSSRIATRQPWEKPYACGGSYSSFGTAITRRYPRGKVHVLLRTLACSARSITRVTDPIEERRKRGRLAHTPSNQIRWSRRFRREPWNSTCQTAS